MTLNTFVQNFTIFLLKLMLGLNIFAKMHILNEIQDIPYHA